METLGPERCRALASAGEDVQRIFVPSMFDWSPLADALRLGEFKLRLLAELLSRLRAGTWRLIWLHPTQGAKPFLADLLAELTLDSFDIKKSELILGGWRYHVRVEQIDPDHDQPAPSGDDKPKPKRHRARDPRDRVIKAMLADLESRRCSPQDLRKNAKALIAIYRTSRSTYARARAEALETFSKFS